MKTLAWLLALAPLGLSAQEAPKPPPPPYSLPWLLRPVAAGNVARLDTTLALFQDAAGRDGSTLVESAIVSFKASPRFAPLVRVSWVRHDPPAAAASGTGFSNPLLGLTYARPLSGPWRLALFGAATIPIGSGGGGGPDPAAASALAAGIPARSAMDNALFAIDYFTVIGGASVARVTKPLTLQAEVTVLQLTRVRGPETQDRARTNLTAGIHLGRFFGRSVSLGAELRLQRWMTDAAPVRADARARETLTFGLGPRFHFKLGGRMLRPGLSWTHALDAPLRTRGYDMLGLDVPVAF
jgi:hypothetical protein